MMYTLQLTVLTPTEISIAAYQQDSVWGVLGCKVRVVRLDSTYGYKKVVTGGSLKDPTYKLVEGWTTVHEDIGGTDWSTWSSGDIYVTPRSGFSARKPQIGEVVSATVLWVEVTVQSPYAFTAPEPGSLPDCGFRVASALGSQIVPITSMGMAFECSLETPVVTIARGGSADIQFTLKTQQTSPVTALLLSNGLPNLLAGSDVLATVEPGGKSVTAWMTVTAAASLQAGTYPGVIYTTVDGAPEGSQFPMNYVTFNVT